MPCARFEGLEHCFHRVPKGVTRIVHMCCGYPDHLDDEDYKKADPDSYSKLANYAKLSLISCPLRTHCCNEPSLLDKFSKKTIIFGTVAVARSRVETVEEIAARLKSVLNHIDRDRLVVALIVAWFTAGSDCCKKLSLMVKATKLI